MSVAVIDLRTGKVCAEYSCTPEEAVVAAYMQSRGDYNTWDYDTGLARVGLSGLTVSCGDFAAMRTDEGESSCSLCGSMVEATTTGTVCPHCYAETTFPLCEHEIARDHCRTCG